MLFEIIAPYYNWFMKKVNMDYSGSMAEWLSPVEGMEILDLGGGTGINARPLAGAGARVTIMDSSRAMLAQAGKDEINARQVRGDAADMPFEDRSFDIVLISDAWHHFRSQYRILAEIARVLRPGGRLYIIDFDRKKPKTWYLLVLEKLVGEPSSFWTPEALAAALESLNIFGKYRYLTSNQYIYKGIKDN